MWLLCVVAAADHCFIPNTTLDHPLIPVLGFLSKSYFLICTISYALVLLHMCASTSFPWLISEGGS